MHSEAIPSAGIHPATSCDPVIEVGPGRSIRRRRFNRPDDGESPPVSGAGSTGLFPLPDGDKRDSAPIPKSGQAEPRDFNPDRLGSIPQNGRSAARFHQRYFGSGATQTGGTSSADGFGPETQGLRAFRSGCTSKISSIPAWNSSRETSRPVLSSTTETPQLNGVVRWDIGRLLNVGVDLEDARNLERPTNA